MLKHIDFLPGFFIHLFSTLCGPVVSSTGALELNFWDVSPSFKGGSEKGDLGDLNKKGNLYVTHK